MAERTECDRLEDRVTCYHKVVARKEKDLSSNCVLGDYLKDGYRDCYTCNDKFNYVCERYTPYE